MLGICDDNGIPDRTLDGIELCVLDGSLVGIGLGT